MMTLYFSTMESALQALDDGNDVRYVLQDEQQEYRCFWKNSRIAARIGACNGRFVMTMWQLKGNPNPRSTALVINELGSLIPV